MTRAEALACDRRLYAAAVVVFAFLAGWACGDGDFVYVAVALVGVVYSAWWLARTKKEQEEG